MREIKTLDNIKPTPEGFMLAVAIGMLEISNNQSEEEVIKNLYEKAKKYL